MGQATFTLLSWGFVLQEALPYLEEAVELCRDATSLTWLAWDAWTGWRDANGKVIVQDISLGNLSRTEIECDYVWLHVITSFSTFYQYDPV